MKMDKEAAALKATQDREKEVFEKAVSVFRPSCLSSSARNMRVCPRQKASVYNCASCQCKKCWQLEDVSGSERLPLLAWAHLELPELVIVHPLTNRSALRNQCKKLIRRESRRRSGELA
jgi:hypothetical protein